MNSLKIIINAAVALVLLCSCNAGGATAAFSGGDTVKLEHAQLLHIIKHKGYTVVTIDDPWNKGKTLHTYVLVPDGMKSPVEKDDIGGNTTLVSIPLKRAVITTSVHCGLVMNLGKDDAIRGTCDLNYINIPWIKQQHSIGKIADCGNSTTPTLEKIISINADAVLISPFQNSGGYGRLDEWGNPIIEMADYMETSPLGRAEWMKFYGLLFGAEKEADSLFNKVEKNYNDLKAIAGKSSTRLSMIIDKVEGPVWYVPGGRNTIGQMIADANAGYAFSDDKAAVACNLHSRRFWPKPATPTCGCTVIAHRQRRLTHPYFQNITAMRNSKLSRKGMYMHATPWRQHSMRTPPSVRTCSYATSS